MDNGVCERFTICDLDSNKKKEYVSKGQLAIIGPNKAELIIGGLKK